METQDYPRFIKAIDEAIQGLELEARCYGYREETEHTELIALLQNYKAKMQESEKRDHFIWKAKHQRGLSDEQIAYFFEMDGRAELLPYYSFCLKRVGAEAALEEVAEIIHLDENGQPKAVPNWKREKE